METVTVHEPLRGPGSKISLTQRPRMELKKFERLKSWHPGNFTVHAPLSERRKSLNDIPNVVDVHVDSRLSPLTLMTSRLGLAAVDSSDDLNSFIGGSDSDSDTCSDSGGTSDTAGAESVSSYEQGGSDSGTEKTNSVDSPNLLRSNARIRKGYLASLGIGSEKPQNKISGDPSMGVHARRAAMASARTRRKPPAMRVKLKDDDKQSSGFGQALLKKFASWMTAEEENKYNSESRVVKREEARRLRQIPQDDADRRVVFLEETDVHFVPSRREISPRNRARLWHTREEFIDMVVRNMDQVEEEMNKKAEVQRRLEDLKKHPPPPLRPRTDKKK